MSAAMEILKDLTADKDRRIAEFERQLATALLEEREACAKLVESDKSGVGDGRHRMFAELCRIADAIRARS